jgi:hypothetical protein
MTDLIRNRAWIGEYEAVDDGEDYDEDALSFGDEDEDYEILKILKMVNVRIASRLLLSMIFKLQNTLCITAGSRMRGPRSARAHDSRVCSFLIKESNIYIHPHLFGRRHLPAALRFDARTRYKMIPSFATIVRILLLGQGFVCLANRLSPLRPSATPWRDRVVRRAQSMSGT